MGQGAICFNVEYSVLTHYSNEQQFTPLGGGPNMYKPLQIGIPGPSVAPKLAKYAGTRRTHSAMDDGGPASKRAKTSAAPERTRSGANKQVFSGFPRLNFSHEGLRRRLPQRPVARRLREGVRASLSVTERMASSK